MRRREDIHSKRRGYMRATCEYIFAQAIYRVYIYIVYIYETSLVTLTPRINIPYAPLSCDAFADCQWRERTGPSGNTGQGQRDRDEFHHTGIYFIRQSDNTKAISLRLPWKIRFYKADSSDSTSH